MTDVFLARQPIFDINKNVFAYELLFRSGVENFYDTSVDGDYASSQLIADSFLIVGINEVTQGKRGFINFTKNLLLSGAAANIPKDYIAVEILETVEPDTEVIEACKELKRSGYMIVLDDFVFEHKYRPLIDLADIIKVDFIITKGQDRKSVLQDVGKKDIAFLAEKVETNEEFQDAVEMGYTYFQGYFFSKPQIIKAKDIPANKLTYMNILCEINKPDVGFDTIEEIIKRDVSLSFKLLKFINSTFFGLGVKVESIKRALVLLGIDEIKKWTSLIALAGLADDKPQELLTTSLVRAKHCEFIAEKIGLKEQLQKSFFLGLFSLIDALIDRPMDDILKDLPLADEIKDALMGEKNLLADVYGLATAYEQADWKGINACAQQLNIAEEDLPGLHFNALKWANEVL